MSVYYVLARTSRCRRIRLTIMWKNSKGLGLPPSGLYYAIESFLKSGLPIDKIAPFVEAIRNIAPTIRGTGGQFAPASTCS